MAKISPLTQKLIKDLSREKKSSKKKSDYFVRIEREPKSKIFLNKLLEKQNNGERRAMRRRIISSFLKKMLSDENFLKANQKTSARFLLSKLISCGYFSKNKIKNSKFEKIGIILEKYCYLFKNAPNKTNSFKRWIASIASCEIEEVLWPEKQEKTLTLYMTRSLIESSIIDTKSEQINTNFLFQISSKKALFQGVDFSVFSYYFIKNKYLFWSPASEKDLEKILKTINNDEKEAEKEFKSVAYRKIFLFCKKNTLPFLLIKDLFKKEQGKTKDLLSDPHQTEKKVKKLYEERKKQAEKNVYFSGMIVAVLLFLFNLSFFGFNINSLASLVGVFLIPTLVLFLTVTTPLPLDKNKNKALLKVIDLIYKKEKKEKEVISLEEQPSQVVFAVNFFYFFFFLALMMFFIFLLLVVEMKAFHSFVFFCGLLSSSFLVIKARQKGKNLFVIEKKEKVTEVMLEALSFPLLKTEKALEINERRCHPAFIITETLTRINKKDILDVLRGWKLKLKEKKEKIYEIN
jgi:hypothetical protein